jgi:hypothetical protein
MTVKQLKASSELSFNSRYLHLAAKQLGVFDQIYTQCDKTLCFVDELR